MENQNNSEKAFANQNVITISLVVIALSLFVQTVMQLSSDGEPQSSAPMASTAPAPQPQSNPASNTQVIISENEHDFGTIKAGDHPKHTFKITNTGSLPLQLNNVTVDKGLNLVSWTNQPVLPQQSAEITVEINTEIFDNQQKTIHANMNANSGHQHFVVKANLVK